MNRQIRQLITSQALLQLHLQYQQNLLCTRVGARRIRTKSRQQTRLRHLISILRAICGGAARPHKQVPQVRHKTCRTHRIRVELPLVACLNNFKNLRENLGHAECLRHVRRRKLRVDQVQRQRNSFVRVQLNLQALANHRQHCATVLHLARVENSHLRGEWILHPHPVTRTNHRIVQVISQRKNKRVRQLQRTLGAHLRLQKRGNRQNLRRNLRQSHAQALTRHTLLRHKRLLHCRRVNQLALTLTKGNAATNHHGLLAVMIHSEDNIVVINTANTHVSSSAGVGAPVSGWHTETIKGD